MEYKPSYTDSLRADILPSYSDSLMHYGVLGMKWGVRRYQNKDGTYTAQGKKHRQQGFRLSENQKKALGVAAGVTVAVAGAYITSNPKVRKFAYDMMYKHGDKTVDDILNETTSNGKITYRDVGDAYVNEILLRDPLQSGTDSVTGKRKPFMALPAKGETSPDESAQRRLEDLKYDRDEAIDDYNNYLNNVFENTEITRKRNSYDAQRRRMNTLEKRRQDARQSVKEYEDYKKSLGHDDIYGNYLMHHGIKGQKWGVRRYQNRDGSYTSQGKKHRSRNNRAFDDKKRALVGGAAIAVGAVIGANTIRNGVKTAKGLKETYDDVKLQKYTDRIMKENASDLKTFEPEERHRIVTDIAKKQYKAKKKIHRRLMIEDARRAGYTTKHKVLSKIAPTKKSREAHEFDYRYTEPMPIDFKPIGRVPYSKEDVSLYLNDLKSQRSKNQKR